MTHAHSHAHTHAPRDLNGAFKGALALNAGFVVVEAGVGFWADSLALLADAAHNLTDVSGLLIAWAAVAAAKKKPSERYTYGYGRTTILAALANALLMLISVGAVFVEGLQRFSNPVEIPAFSVALTALIGIGVNAGTALLFHKDREHDLNVRGAYLHMIMDAAVSLGVVVAALLVAATGWQWLDPAMALLVSFLIAWATFDLLKSSLRLSLDGVPADVDREAVRAWLLEQEGVASVHDLHIWALSTTKNALTAHLKMPAGHPGDAFFDHAADELAEHFGIQHVTLQIETENDACSAHSCD